MSIYQTVEDERNLISNNRAIGLIVDAIPGAARKRLGKDYDTGTAIFALTVGQYTFEFDHLNKEFEVDYHVSVRARERFVPGEKYLGSKTFSGYFHLLGGIKKIARLTPEQVADYLKKTLPNSNNLR